MTEARANKPKSKSPASPSDPRHMAAPAPGAEKKMGSLWSALEDQRLTSRETVPLLTSTWGLPTGEDAERRRNEGLRQRAARWWREVCAGAADMWAFARADRRKPVFAAKVALALALITLLVFLREPRDIVKHSIWAILTVVVVFEFSIGARPDSIPLPRVLILGS
jgi:hypothetical protein